MSTPAAKSANDPRSALCQVRESRQMTLEAWATHLCLSQTVVEAVEEGERVPTPEMLAVLPVMGVEVKSVVRAHAAWAIRKATKAIQGRPGRTPWGPSHRRR